MVALRPRRALKGWRLQERPELIGGRLLTVRAHHESSAVFAQSETPLRVLDEVADNLLKAVRGCLHDRTRDASLSANGRTDGLPSMGYSDAAREHGFERSDTVLAVQDPVDDDIGGGHQVGHPIRRDLRDVNVLEQPLFFESVQGLSYVLRALPDAPTWGVEHHGHVTVID